MTFHPQMPYKEGLHKSERELMPGGEAFQYTAENREALEEIAKRYPPEQRQSAVLPALYLVQEQQGYITASAMRHVAAVLGITPAQVEDVVTYYVMFFREPVGKYVLQVCRTLSCALRGSERVLEELSAKLGIEVGETDAAQEFTLTEFECLGACDRAPVVMVNNEHWHECLQPGSASRLVDDLRARGLAALSGCVHSVQGDT